MGKALDESIAHWDSIMNEVSLKTIIPRSMYGGQECPLCKEYYSDHNEMDSINANCWACPLAYRRWKESGETDDCAFSGTCADEWQLFSASMYEYKSYKNLSLVGPDSYKWAAKMRHLLTTIDEEERFKDFKDFEKEVLEC